MTNYKYLRGASISDPFNKIADVPDAPTIGTVTDVGTSQAYNNGSATVAFTGPAATGGATASYIAKSNPGSFTATGTSSPITITGLQSSTAYTYQVAGVNSSGTGSYGTSSSAVTATTVPQAPTIGTFTDGGTGTTGTLSFTAGSTGGTAITGYKVSTDGTTYTTVSGTTSPLSLTGLTAGTYTFYLKATNANGDSSASSGVSGTVALPSSFESIATALPSAVSTITLSSIPATYKSLQLRFSVVMSFGGSSFSMIVNGNSSSSYASHYIAAYGTTVTASGGANLSAMYLFQLNGGLATYPNVGIVDFLDYANTSKNKTIKSSVGSNNNTSNGSIELSSGLWFAPNAINSITFAVGTGTMTGSVALYGIKG
jgi:hypothetical protein